MTHVQLAEALADLANECCYRSDGWQEDLAAQFRELLDTHTVPKEPE